MTLTVHTVKPLNVEIVQGTVLFADLRGYTTLAEYLDPALVVSLLEAYFDKLATAVDAHGGRIYHLAGDAVMAGFGMVTETTASGAARAAISCGRQIVRDCELLARRWAADHGIVTGVGVGVHGGPLAHADLGPLPIRTRTLIGDTVNVAARLCQRARAREVLFSSHIARALDAEDGDAMALPALALRGRDTPVEIYCLPSAERLTTGRAAVRSL
jgi:class 3 adenylate cyclase